MNRHHHHTLLLLALLLLVQLNPAHAQLDTPAPQPDMLTQSCASRATPISIPDMSLGWLPLNIAAPSVPMSLTLQLDSPTWPIVSVMAHMEPPHASPFPPFWVSLQKTSAPQSIPVPAGPLGTDARPWLWLARGAPPAVPVPAPDTRLGFVRLTAGLDAYTLAWTEGLTGTVTLMAGRDGDELGIVGSADAGAASWTWRTSLAPGRWRLVAQRDGLMLAERAIEIAPEPEPQTCRPIWLPIVSRT